MSDVIPDPPQLHPAGVNWAGNHVYDARGIHEPGSVDELQELVRRASNVRALGTRHAFNDLTDTPGDLVSLRRLPRRLEIDPAAATVTVDGGLTYGELSPRLDEAGLALHNLASLPHISVAGACATGTHGSGNRLGALATAVTSVSLVRGDGELVTIDGGTAGDALSGAAVGLGSLGIVTAVTLRVQPAYRMRQLVDDGLTFAAFEQSFDWLSATADSVSCFTDWSSPTFQVWRKQVVRSDEDAPPERVPGTTPATVEVHPIPGLPADACTPQLGVVGPWHERLPHFRFDHRPSAGAELQSEYLLPREHAVPALRALAAIAGRVSPLTLVSEVRTVAADRLWLSPASARESVAFHFTWVRDWRAVRAVLPAVEAALRPYEPRPHWGKLFTLGADDIVARYPDRERFVALAGELDPGGKFRNAFVNALVFCDAG
jgi:alditol oxidase